MFSVGISTYDDYNGLYFTIQSLKLHHPLVNEVVVIDNNPKTKIARFNKDLANTSNNNFKIKYVEYRDKVSTSSREEVFKYVNNNYVVICDSHVLFATGAFESLKYFYENESKPYDFIQGPLIYDNGIDISTHFNKKWGSYMYGQWETRHTQERWFEIDAQGLGAFACKKDEWLGFNKHFDGFGGEEHYIHEKYRRKGGRCICLSGFKWMHRFNRPEGIPFPNNLEQRFKNYIIGRMEFNLDYDDVIEAFKEGLSADSIDNAISLCKQLVKK